MEIKDIPVTTNAKGEISCGDIGITTKEWYDLLKQPSSEAYINELTCILRMPRHQTSCKSLSETFGQLPQHYNSKITAFSKWVQKTLGRFRVVRPGGKDCYWTIPMSKGKDDKTGFVWYLRDELAEALQSVLIEQLIDKFRSKCQTLSFENLNETYKWELINKNDNASTLDIIRSLKGVNVVSNMHVDGIFKYLTENRPDELSACVDNLFDESKPLDIRLAKFKTEMKSMAKPDSKVFANDERTAAALLTCKYPEKYTVYMNTLYQLICSYLGIETQKAGRKYTHYMQIINGITQHYEHQILPIIADNISHFHLKPSILATQTLLWCMQDEMMKSGQREIWMTGCFIEEDMKDEFIEQNYWKGQFNDDSESDQELMGLADSFKMNDIIVLKSTGTKGIKHDKSFLRIKAVGIICGEMEFSKTDGATIGICPVRYLNTDETDFEGAYYGSYSKSINSINRKHKDILKYILSFLDDTKMTTSIYEPYIKLLKANKNLVLTGAPGTGKTYMAQAIARVMDAESELVQFHPSYDYTDFVEGLRPVQDQISGQIGFERKDGVFKRFCKLAAQNLIDSRKSTETLQKENDWKTRLWQFASDAMENNTPLHLTKGGQFNIVDINDNNITVYNEENQKTQNLSINVPEILTLLNNEVPLHNVHDIRDYFGRTFGTQPDSYAFVITNEVRKVHAVSKDMTSPMVKRKDFVFIIDEINRGEASKIFGELFYALDPGYRDDLKENTQKRVQTQYQNLIPETDLFAKGFCVPENVYILATMNDIDRSVESMDFAMRRRFTWKEVTPRDTESMLEGHIDHEVLPEALARMHHLNNAISNVDELGSAYMIGPSYFLKLRDYDNSFEDLWALNLEPLLKEYLRGVRRAKALLDKFKEAYQKETEDNDDENSDAQ